MLCATHDRSPATTCPADCLPPLCPLTSPCSITRYQWAVFVFTLSQRQLQTPTCWRENKQTFEGVTEVLEVTLTVSVCVYREGGGGAGRSRHDTPRLAVCHLKSSISSLLQRPPHFSRVPWVCSERAVLIMCSGLSERSFVLSR
ncbi:hypothetical protein KUCAC02_002015 [Chaenocephalus aceratus]|uniref:Uncharacterized protein n=1 Tax=Chaenocephalus aceratus TaxID=36190 RepID=A0ACB9XUP3_CHAAC|nr:hypothetical protein KUCAC02_002015 [Chaenocephalus aceratus]